MKTFVGLDVSQKKTSICVIDPDGNKIRMVNVETHPAVIANYLFSEGFDKSKVALETGPLSVWLYHSLKSYGLDVDCIHARHVHAALSMQLNKTDQNDAFGIARLVLSGWYKPVHVKSLECHQQRLILTSREKLVQLRVVVTNQIRGLLKTFGVVLPPGKNSVFERAVKGYSGRNLRIYLKMKGIKAVIPFKSNEKASQDGRRPLDTRLYKKRNVVERCFAILKENRRIATRSEKTARNYLIMLKLGAIRLFLKRLLS